jgi:hypothetical protein
MAGLSVCASISASIAAVMIGDEEEKKTPPKASTLPSGRYVKLVHTNKEEVINLAELEVFAKAGTTSLAAGKTVTASAFLGGYTGTLLVDGIMTNFAHTLNEVAATEDSMLIDLGSVQEIEKIKITNRVDCCQERAIGIKVVILGADGTTVVKETPAITTNAATYTFTFPGMAWV